MVRSRFMRAVSLSFIAAVLASCARQPPPAAERIDAAVSPLPPPAAASASPAAGRTETTPSPEARDAGSIPASSADAGDAGNAGALPQTHDKPAASSPALEARAKTLWDGIVRDEPDAALPFFFPVTAYEQVKDVGSPASDWKHRLVGAYRRDIHELHKQLGSKAAGARFVRLDVPDARARWVEPKEEYNKLGYYRVYGTRIVYEVDGKERTFDISSLISWRGEWYVVHLTGFK